jgi:hypothetical protein
MYHMHLIKFLPIHHAAQLLAIGVIIAHNDLQVGRLLHCDRVVVDICFIGPDRTHLY